MLVSWDDERRHGVVLESEPRPLHTGTGKRWVRIQKRLNPPFAPHLDAGDDRRASRRALRSAVTLPRMGMDVVGVMCERHLRAPESPHTASAQPYKNFGRFAQDRSFGAAPDGNQAPYQTQKQALQPLSEKTSWRPVRQGGTRLV